MPETPAETIRRAAKLIRERAAKATAGPWWCDESDQCWRLHGVAFTTPPFLNTDGSALIPGQVVNSQILKAPKKGTPYAEYWPGDADATWITSMHPGFGPVLAGLLEFEAALIDAQSFPRSDPAAERWPLEVARFILGETEADLARADAACALDGDLDDGEAEAG